MKKFVLVLLVLVFVVPAMGTVTISYKRGLAADTNKVTVRYKCTSEEVRAFALDVTVSDSAYVVGSIVRLSNDYYIHPTNIKFDVNAGGITVVNSYGSPAVNETVNGFTLEMASLYAAADVNHPAAPPTSGNLVKFAVDCTKCGADYRVIVKITTNAQRGGVVLKDPNTALTPVFSPTYAAGLSMLCEYCWKCPTQQYGDAGRSAVGQPPDGTVNVYDLGILRKAYGMNYTTGPRGTGAGQYNCCADFCGSATGSAPDETVNIYDLGKLRAYYGQTVGGACALVPPCCVP